MYELAQVPLPLCVHDSSKISSTLQLYEAPQSRYDSLFSISILLYFSSRTLLKSTVTFQAFCQIYCKTNINSIASKSITLWCGLMISGYPFSLGIKLQSRGWMKMPTISFINMSIYVLHMIYPLVCLSVECSNSEQSKDHQISVYTSQWWNPVSKLEYIFILWNCYPEPYPGGEFDQVINTIIPNYLSSSLTF